MGCFIRRIKARLKGIHWSGHCWDGDDTQAWCIDCGRKG